MSLIGFATRKERKEDKNHYQMSEARAVGENVAHIINPDARTPNMEPSGPDDALLYVLGEAPGKQEDDAGEPFVGLSGRLVRECLGEYQDRTRINNTCRTRPPENRDPTPFEIECYRESVEQDIVDTAPAVVICVGRLAAAWAIPECKKLQTALFRGSAFPCELRGHKFWAVPVLHPAYVMRSANDKKIGAAIKDQFKRDIDRCIELAEGCAPKPIHADTFFNHEGTELLVGYPGELERLQDFVDECEEHGRVVAADIETKGGRPYAGDAELLTIAFASKDRAVAVAIQHSGSAWADGDGAKAELLIEQLLRSPSCRIVWHNAPYDLEWVGHRYGWDAVRPDGDYKHWHDTMAEAYVLDHRNIKGSGHSLDFVCRKVLGTSFKALAGVDRASLSSTPVYDVLAYNAADCRATLALHNRQLKEIKKQKLMGVYNTQRRRISTTVLAQLHGVPCNQKRVQRLHREYTTIIEDVESRLGQTPAVKKYEQQFGAFNPNSDHDQRRLFGKVLGVDIGVGKGSLDANALANIDDESAQIIVERRKAVKLLSTYIVPMQKGHKESVVWGDGLIHPVINNTFTRTGRLSYDRPNLQNQPKRDKTAMKIRRLLKPSKTKCVLSNDYGQIEWRVVAMASGDEYMIHAIENGIDVHKRWALKIANKFSDIIEGQYGSMDDPSNLKAFRGVVKNSMVFPAIYLAHEDYIARLLGVPEIPFRKLFKQFWDELSGVKRWQEQIVRYYKKHGYIYGLTGRKYYSSANYPILTKNDIANYPIQGSALDICVDAMCRLSERALEENNHNILPILQIHDDLTFISDRDTLGDSIRTIVAAMLESPFDFINVPLQVETSVGTDWSNQKEIGVYSSGDWNPDMIDDTILDQWSTV